MQLELEVDICVMSSSTMDIDGHIAMQCIIYSCMQPPRSIAVATPACAHALLKFKFGDVRAHASVHEFPATFQAIYM